MRFEHSTHIVTVAALATLVTAGLATACSAADPDAIHFADYRGDDAASAMTSAVDAAPLPAPTSIPTRHGEAGAPESATDAAPSASDGASDALASDAPTGLAVLSFTLLDTSITGVIQGSPVTGYDPLPQNSNISLAQVGTQLSIRANVGSTPPGSVGFLYDATAHTEGAAPYTLCGDDGAGTITNCNLAAGTHTLTATPWSAPNLAGTPGAPLTITFTLDP